LIHGVSNSSRDICASSTASRALRQPAVLGSRRAPVPAHTRRSSATASPPCGFAVPAISRFRPTVTTCAPEASIACASTSGDG